MAQIVSNALTSGKYHRAAIRQESPLVRNMLMAVVFIFLGLFLLMPVAVILVTAFQKGFGEYWHAITM
ncbi:MAG: sulfate/thiosulfate ABC transporter permease CysW, partial [bacterium]|nr:sulfate/thiosulfate ABC transporter permease CysW [bacterium]